MDVGSNNKYPANSLSNFAPHHFIFDNVQCNSMEGFLQSLKFKDPETQKNVCLKVGIKAKSKGLKKKWWVKQELYWQGLTLPRESPDYIAIVDQAYIAMTMQNKKFQRALLASKDAVYKHSLGKKKKSETILTRSEVTSELTRMRGLLLSGAIPTIK